MKKFFFLFIIGLVVYAQDQDMGQITGASDVQGSRANNKNEIEELKKEIRELKKQVAELKGAKPKDPKEKETESALDKILSEKKEEKESESQARYSNFERDFFMQIHPPDFKKSLMERYQWQLLFWAHGNYSKAIYENSTIQTLLQWIKPTTEYILQ